MLPGAVGGAGCACAAEIIHAIISMLETPVLRQNQLKNHNIAFESLGTVSWEQLLLREETYTDVGCCVLLSKCLSQVLPAQVGH